jgi:hypothetical protein
MPHYRVTTSLYLGEDNDIHVLASAEYIPGIRGSYDEPPEPAEFDDIQVTLYGTKIPYEPSETELTKVEEALMEQVAQDMDDAAADRAEARRDQQRDDDDDRLLID